MIQYCILEDTAGGDTVRKIRIQHCYMFCIADIREVFSGRIILDPIEYW